MQTPFDQYRTQVVPDMEEARRRAAGWASESEVRAGLKQCFQVVCQQYMQMPDGPAKREAGAYFADQLQGWLYYYGYAGPEPEAEHVQAETVDSNASEAWSDCEVADRLPTAPSGLTLDCCESELPLQEACEPTSAIVLDVPVGVGNLVTDGTDANSVPAPVGPSHCLVQQSVRVYVQTIWCHIASWWLMNLGQRLPRCLVQWATRLVSCWVPMMLRYGRPAWAGAPHCGQVTTHSSAGFS